MPLKNRLERNEYQRKYSKEVGYPKHKVNRIKQKDKWVSKLRMAFGRYKETLKCLICEENSSACLDFHHLDPDEKEGSVSHMALEKGAARLKEEIEKCVVLCANCHRKFHADKVKLPLNVQPIVFDLAKYLEFSDIKTQTHSEDYK